MEILTASFAVVDCRQTRHVLEAYPTIAFDRLAVSLKYLLEVFRTRAEQIFVEDE